MVGGGVIFSSGSHHCLLRITLGSLFVHIISNLME